MDFVNRSTNPIELPLLARLLRAYLRTSLRGRTRLTRILAGKFQSLRAVPVILKDRSPIYVDLRFDMSHFWLGGSPWATSPFELDEQAVMRRVVRPGETAFDIGANLGLHTALLARVVGPQGRVCVFEPNRLLIPTLNKTVKMMGNAALFPVALSDHIGESTLYVPNDHSMGSLADYTSDPSLEEWRERIGLSKAETLPCEVSSIDFLIASNLVPKPDFIKCDVEGAEVMVFRGGHMAINHTDGPIILFEVREECSRGFGLSRAAAIDFLRSLPLPRYRFFEVRAGGELLPLTSGDSEFPNVLAVPESKLDRVNDVKPVSHDTTE